MFLIPKFPKIPSIGVPAPLKNIRIKLPLINITLLPSESKKPAPVTRPKPPPPTPVEISAYAKAALVEIEKLVEVAIKSIDDLNTPTPDKLVFALLTEVSLYSNQLHAVSFQLKRVMIKSFTKGNPKKDLQVFCVKFNNFVNGLQKLFTQNPDQLKSQLKNGLKDLVPVVKDVVNLIDNDNNHPFKEEISSAIFRIIFAVQTIIIRNEIQNYTQSKRGVAFTNAINGMVESLDKIKSNTDATLQNVVRNTRNFIPLILDLMTRLVDDAENYDGDIRIAFLRAAFNIEDDIGVMDDSLRTRYNIGDFKNETKAGSATIINEIITLVNATHETELKDVVLNNLLLHAMSYVISCSKDAENRFNYISSTIK